MFTARSSLISFPVISRLYLDILTSVLPPEHWTNSHDLHLSAGWWEGVKSWWRVCRWQELHMSDWIALRPTWWLIDPSVITLKTLVIARYKVATCQTRWPRTGLSDRCAESAIPCNILVLFPNCRSAKYENKSAISLSKRCYIGWFGCFWRFLNCGNWSNLPSSLRNNQILLYGSEGRIRPCDKMPFITVFFLWDVAEQMSWLDICTIWRMGR